MGLHYTLSRELYFPLLEAGNEGMAKMETIMMSYMNHNLNSLKWGSTRDYIGNYYRGYQGGYSEFRL